MNVKKLVTAALIGGIYTALTLLLAPISYGIIQCRVSEALGILPFFAPYTAWGLFIGCLLSNLLGGMTLLDIIFGPIATLAAALLAARIRKKWLVPLPSVLINAVVVGAVLTYTEVPHDAFFSAYWINAASVGIGQAGALYGLGLPLLYALPKWPFFTRTLTSIGGAREEYLRKSSGA